MLKGSANGQTVEVLGGVDGGLTWMWRMGLAEGYHPFWVGGWGARTRAFFMAAMSPASLRAHSSLCAFRRSSLPAPSAVRSAPEGGAGGAPGRRMVGRAGPRSGDVACQRSHQAITEWMDGWN